jgi:phage anti-repressor protein
MMQKNEKNVTNQSPIDFDFSHLYDTFNELLTTSNSNPFPVDFDEAWQWVGFTTKGNAFRLLKRKFKQNIDYQVFIFKDKNPQGGRPKEGVCLSIDCFKMFCMLAETELGDNVRLYFLDCEKKLKEVKDLAQQATSDASELLQRINTRLEVLEAENQELKTKVAEHEDDVITLFEAFLQNAQKVQDLETAHGNSFYRLQNIQEKLAFLEKLLEEAQQRRPIPMEIVKFYVIREGETTSHKFGISAKPPKRRSTLNTGNSLPLSIAITITFYSRIVAKSFETHLKILFAHKAFRGEWFNLNEEDLACIEEVGLAYQKMQERYFPITKIE